MEKTFCDIYSESGYRIATMEVSDFDVDCKVGYCDEMEFYRVSRYSLFKGSAMKATVSGKVVSVPLEFFKENTNTRLKKVVYNNPATVAFWTDGTKTVVKCQDGDTYDPMKGLALCYMKKMLGNSSRAFNDTLHGEGF